MAPPHLIFGATGGVGASLARRLSADGEPLFLAGRDEDALNTVADELGAPCQVCDVLDDDQLQSVIEAAGGEGLKSLVFAVGSIDLLPLKRSTREPMRSSFELNAVSAAQAVRLAQPALKKAKGSVVLFSTVACQQGFANHTVIAAAKGAVEGLVLSLGTELAPDIRVNAVAPSLLQTKMAEQLTGNEKMRESIAQMHALPRLGEGDDVAAAARFLVSDEASWVTGQVLGVDGGRSSLRTKG
jgi:NAD(P)-dependent dehydrogenase (short-subunit alcohol dehydrogenase family)